MTQYRIKARIDGFWNFLVDAESIDEARSEARRVFRETESARPTIRITSVNKLSNIGLGSADRKTRERVARKGGRAKKKVIKRFIERKAFREKAR